MSCKDKLIMDVKEINEKIDSEDNSKPKIDSIDLSSSPDNETLIKIPSQSDDDKKDIQLIDEYKVTETTIINGNIYELLNGLPVFDANKVFAERFKIYERETYIDSQGVGYFCTDVKCDQLELFLRIDKKKNSKTILKTEYKLLKTAEEDCKYGYFSQIHSVGEYDDFIYMATYFKGGPTLKDIRNFMNQRKFSHGTIGRFAHDIFTILQKVHEYGYLLHNIATEKFTFDACSRSLYLNDYTNIMVDKSKSISPVKDLYKNPSKYLGSLDYAPFYFLEADIFPPPPGIFARDELESAFYLIIDLLLGDLPWKQLRRSEVLPTKREYIKEGKILKDIPKQYQQLWCTICSSSEYDPMIYPKLLEICKDIHENLGGIKDLDDNYDFEVEPNPEDIPRFILEKRPIENENNETIEIPAS